MSVHFIDVNSDKKHRTRAVSISFLQESIYDLKKIIIILIPTTYLSTDDPSYGKVGKSPSGL